MSNSSKTSKASVSFIFATIVLDCLGIGFIVPTLPDVIRRLTANPADVNDYFGYFIAMYAAMQFFASPILGSLSDRYGRRPVLLFSLLGAGLDYLLMAFAPNLSILFIGRLISGLTGASMTVATSYIADVSDDKNRSANFGMIGAAFGIGFIIGPLVGGLLAEWGPSAPFVGAAILNLINFAFGLFVLPESLPSEHRRSIAIKSLNPLRSLAKILKPSPIFVLVIVYALQMLAGQVHPSAWTLYTQHKFGWSAADVGFSLAFVGVSVAFVQGFLTRKIIPKWGEPRALRFGLSIEFIGYGLWSLATHGWMMYAIMAFASLAGLGPPALRSIITKDVPQNEQGELQGSLISITSLMAIVAPLLYTHGFDWATRQAPEIYPGLPYGLASLFSFTALCLAVVHLRRNRH